MALDELGHGGEHATHDGGEPHVERIR
jgi:hypothetical protein